MLSSHPWLLPFFLPSSYFIFALEFSVLPFWKFLPSIVKLSHMSRYHDDACVGFVCICGLIHGTIHA